MDFLLLCIRSTTWFVDGAKNYENFVFNAD